MFHSLTVLLFVILSAVGIDNINAESTPLYHRALCTYTCPPTDLGFYPLGLGSAPSNGGTLFCNYPFVYWCMYTVGNGTMIDGDDGGHCRTVADCSSSSCTCPSTDNGGVDLGTGSGAHSAILFCTYPTAAQLSDTINYCNYNMSNGALEIDHDDNLCPGLAMEQSCQPTSTTSIIITSTFIPPSPTHTGPSESQKTRRIIGIAVGSSVGALFLLISSVVAFILYRRSTQRHAIIIESPPMSAVPFNRDGQDSWPVHSPPQSPTDHRMVTPTEERVTTRPDLPEI